MYFVLEENREYAFMASFSDENPGHDAKWMMGKLLEPDDNPSGLKLKIEEPRDVYPDFFTEVPAFFCSQRMRDRLKAAGVDNVEFYPLEMVEPSGKRIEEYFVINVIGRLACMDRERSQFKEWRKRITRIQSLALDMSAIKGLKVLRLHEYPELILVSEDVAEALRDLPGVSLKPAEGWSDAHRF
ncbi:hypothetical protein BO221_13750 [Archangium sp. Cb G35]|uniref:imm11 family protein n=1 Tax=Archangium sp. Cb G35 TaxID=1920190 RepID=UPI000936CDC3|nr:DUF1629 domain-containing protein [Archangium sp. Cb G35]OJT24240.1 hypothetical protein BO221_13750 [Archangium sp. Cb G35]